MSILARDLTRMLDPASVMRDAGMEPDGWQEEVLNSDARRMLLLCSRQSGKSTTCASLAVHQALYDPGLVLLIAPAQRQSSELFRKVHEVYRALPDVPRIVQESAMRLELANGSRIIALPGTEGTIRGYSGAKTVIVDEASRVDNALFAAVRPMLATTNGRFVALTTPYGKRGWFYEAWEHGEGWHRTKVTAHDCPRIDPEWLAEERRLIGDWQFRQEYECEFVDTDEQFFASDLIEAALTNEVSPLWN
ncbi:phage terminase large subunit [Luteimonas sp. 50]|uniref:Phage terminase large subunit n=1 Tax=Cognatiluteimonas sedimenti TaxID=2927791 RepID=A0ABT0A4R0_9GAMM|nr:phage terminase large subunit [Lysobacter sedimenti]MCJ0825957.1 phage terminase large subunit [Lysobacter sedimenti]